MLWLEQTLSASELGNYSTVSVQPETKKIQKFPLQDHARQRNNIRSIKYSIIKSLRKKKMNEPTVELGHIIFSLVNKKGWW